MSEVQAIPSGCAAVLPYLVIKNAAAAFDFYQKAFGAETIMRMNMPSGAVMHAEMRIGSATFMFSEQNDAWGTKSPDMLGTSPVTLMVYVPDVDAFVERAAGAGATITMPVSDQFWGDRSGCLQDPFGHLWMISTHVEDVSEEEMAKRSAQMFGQ